MTFNFNSGWFKEVMAQPEVRKATLDAANAVAANADYTFSDGREIKGDVKEYETDRPHFVVGLAHPAGLAIEAKHGTVAKAVSQAGLTLKSKS